MSIENIMENLTVLEKLDQPLDSYFINTSLENLNDQNLKDISINTYTEIVNFRKMIKNDILSNESIQKRSKEFRIHNISDTEFILILDIESIFSLIFRNDNYKDIISQLIAFKNKLLSQPDQDFKLHIYLFTYDLSFLIFDLSFVLTALNIIKASNCKIIGHLNQGINELFDILLLANICDEIDKDEEFGNILINWSYSFNNELEKAYKTFLRYMLENAIKFNLITEEHVNHILNNNRGIITIS